MSVYSASRNRFPFGQSSRRAVPPQSPAEWARSQVTSRATRRLVAAGQRAEQRLQQHLGPSWHLVSRLHTGLVVTGQDHAGFLAIGPGGVFAVSVVDQGRQRVMIAGDVIQIKGDRPPYAARARRYAKTARTALTAAVGTTVPVVAVLTFVGSGLISAQGLPTNCLVVSHRELNRLLTASGEKITPQTAQKLAEIAAHPDTWAAQYRWYPDGETAAGPGDKSPTRR
jgi:hypothetical protein